ncbi:MAG TPA: DUF928 domain-containing protein [Nostocaceae cyanobacterium]|nr:DUF928 domain-containing protein [Nostocaceae cyanobacterium]
MLKKSLLAIALSLGLSANLAITGLVAVAESTSNTVTTKQNTKQVRRNPVRRNTVRRGGLPFKTLGGRATGNREGGAQRGSCTQDQAITALLPPTPQGIEETKMPVEVTVSDHPTFFVNVPATNAKEALFVLRNDKDDVLLKEYIKLNNTKSGIIAYKLPKSFKGLEVGQKYIWRFSLLCNRDDNSGNPRTSAWVQRIEPTAAVAGQLQAAKDELDRFSVYASNGFWQDTLKTLTDLRAANPSDEIVQENWQSILDSVNLSSLVDQPVISLTGIPAEDYDFD